MAIKKHACPFGSVCRDRHVLFINRFAPARTSRFLTRLSIHPVRGRWARSQSTRRPPPRSSQWHKVSSCACLRRESRLKRNRIFCTTIGAIPLKVISSPNFSPVTPYSPRSDHRSNHRLSKPPLGPSPLPTILTPIRLSFLEILSTPRYAQA
jgi:hypothetical protein